MFFCIFLAFIILQRLTELIIAKRNAVKMFSKGAVEYDKDGYKFIVLMHISFFICLIAERTLFDKQLNEYWIILTLLFILAQLLRYWAIASLGEYWNTRIIALKGIGLIKKGPYRFLKHPNYIAVVMEIADIPLIFSCYVTAIVFTVLNLFVLSRRIRIEEEALGI